MQPDMENKKTVLFRGKYADKANGYRVAPRKEVCTPRDVKLKWKRRKKETN